MKRLRHIVVVTVALLAVSTFSHFETTALNAEGLSGDVAFDLFDEYDESFWGGPFEIPMPSITSRPPLVPVGGGPGVHKSSMPRKINTNYDQYEGFKPGATDPDPDTHYADGTPGKPLFPCSVTERYAPTKIEIQEVINLCENPTNPDNAFKITGHNLLSELITDGSCPNVQVVFNHTFSKNAEGVDMPATPTGRGCYNIYFPPYFRAYSPQGKRYGILFISSSWHVSNNYPFFTGYCHDAALSTFLTPSYKPRIQQQWTILHSKRC